MCAALREEGFYGECDTVGRSVKAQMKYADKLGAKFSCIIGEDELTQSKAKIKNMKTGETQEVSLDSESFVDFIYGGTIDEMVDYTDGLIDLKISQMNLQKKGEEDE